MILKPPTKGYTYNGTRVPEEGIEVLDRDVDSLLAAGWKKLEAPKPRKKKSEGTE